MFVKMDHRSGIRELALCGFTYLTTICSASNPAALEIAEDILFAQGQPFTCCQWRNA